MGTEHPFAPLCSRFLPVFFTLPQQLRHQFFNVLLCVTARNDLTKTLQRIRVSDQRAMRFLQHMQIRHQARAVAHGFCVTRVLPGCGDGSDWLPP